MRLFYAVAADTEVKAAATAAIGRLRAAPGDYRWVLPRDMHLTLRFLGETLEESFGEVEQNMRAAASRTAPFEIIYGRVGAFESIEDPRVVWIGVETGLEYLQALADRLGRDEPRSYTPHVTLGRRKRKMNSDRFMNALRAESPLSLRRPVTKISLYASRPAEFGHAYEIVGEAPLTGAGGL